MSFPAGLCFNSVLNTTEDWRAYVVYWDLELFQFGKGIFLSELKAVHTDHLQVSSAWRSTGIFGRGQAPRECLTFVTVPSADAPVYICGAILGSNEMMALRDSEEIEVSTPRIVLRC